MAGEGCVWWGSGRERRWTRRPSKCPFYSFISKCGCLCAFRLDVLRVFGAWAGGPSLSCGLRALRKTHPAVRGHIIDGREACHTPLRFAPRLPAYTDTDTRTLPQAHPHCHYHPPRTGVHRPKARATSSKENLPTASPPLPHLATAHISSTPPTT